jgi:hypothetical protein
MLQLTDKVLTDKCWWKEPIHRQLVICKEVILQVDRYSGIGVRLGCASPWCETCWHMFVCQFCCVSEMLHLRVFTTLAPVLFCSATFSGPDVCSRAAHGPVQKLPRNRCACEL